MFKKTLVAFALVSLLALTGCKAKNNQFFDSVTFKLADDLETVHVALVFKPSVQAMFFGEFMPKEWGKIFITPYSPETPFTVGFDLNSKIFNDQDYVHLQPTDTLPNGVPLGLGYPLVQVAPQQPVSEAFDLYGYVDVLHGKWLGTAAIFSFMSDKNFPAGLAMSMGFKPDNQGNPGILASVFGPVLDNEGNMIRNGGVALLANVRQLIGKSEFEPGREYRYYPEKKKFRKGGPGVLLR